MVFPAGSPSRWPPRWLPRLPAELDAGTIHDDSVAALGLRSQFASGDQLVGLGSVIPSNYPSRVNGVAPQAYPRDGANAVLGRPARAASQSRRQRRRLAGPPARQHSRACPVTGFPGIDHVQADNAGQPGRG